MKIVIGADTVPTELSEKMFIDGDARALFTDVLDVLKSSDRAIVNLECALTDSDGAIKKFGPNLKASPKCVNGLLNAGITDCALANNHVFDFGEKGLTDTMQALKDAKIGYFGVGQDCSDSRKPYFIEQDGKKIAIVNVCEHEYTYAIEDRMGANPFDPFITMQDIRDAKAKADFLIVLYHGGKEHCRYPSPRLINACREMVNNGADAVLTQHSHCIGCYENFKGAHILYGQGNFHFAIDDKDEMWKTCLLVEFSISDKMEIKFYPIVCNGYLLSIAKGDLAVKLMQEFEKRNAQMLNGEWKKGWNDFCQSVKMRYEGVISRFGDVNSEIPEEKRREFFAHYLDCEAHTDVWRELLPTWNATNRTE